MSSYHLLIHKIDDFIRKYYKNQLLRGIIFSAAMVSGAFLFVSLLEYWGNFNSTIRAVLLTSFLATLLFVFVYYIMIPLMKMYKLGKVISNEQAAQIIGTHFADVKDKLMNTLQLKAMADSMPGNELLIAGIEQKIADLKPIPFQKAIDFSENKKYLKYVVPPVIVILILLFATPAVFTESAYRLVNINREFIPKAPFEFELLNDNLKAVENEDFTINIKTSGEELPQIVYIEADRMRYKLYKEKINEFSYTFKGLKKNTSFKLWADGFYSPDYTLEVLSAPVLMSLKLRLEYPSYLQKQPDELRGTGDITIPEGTRVSWVFNTRNTDNLSVILQDTVLKFTDKDNVFELSRKIYDNLSYGVAVSNRQLLPRDTVRYSVNVIKDLYPTIAVDEVRDSLTGTLVFFKGEITDDYGFKGLTFNYKVQNNKSANEKSDFKGVPFNPKFLKQNFLYQFNFMDLDINPGDEIVYYFTVYDNDGVNGSKSAKSQYQVFKVPTLEEISKQTEVLAESIKSELTESISKAEEIRKGINVLNKSLLQKKNLDWQDKKKIEDLMKKHQELEKKLEDLKKENEMRNNKKDQFKKEDQALLDKQKELEKLMDKVMNEELKKLMEELQKMMENMDKNQLQEQMKDLKMSNEDMQKQLERTLELFKQLEFEQKLQETIDKLDKLKEEQKNLSEKSNDKSADSEKQKQEQEELNKKFDEIRKDLDKLEEKNNDLERKNDEFKNTDDKEQQIENKMNEAKEQLGGGQNKKAAGAQKESSQKMEELSNELKQMQEKMEEEQQAEDMAAIRQILENLLRLSFDQEKLMGELKSANRNSPKFRDLTRTQLRLKDESKVIEDSLFALSKRNAQLAPIVNKEIADIRRNMEDALENMSERYVPQAMSNQQYVMTSANNLALILSESMEQMQMQMQSKKQGGGSCSKPGGQGSPKEGMESLKKMQQKLSEQMKKMAEQMKNQDGGNKPQGNKPGGMGNQGMSQQFAQMAAQQEMIRNKLKEMSEQMGNNGQRKLLSELQNKMEENETDLYNKRITQQSLMRQQDIMTRLLESEKALREQEQDDKRESNEGNKKANNLNNPFLEYQKQKEKESELLRTVPASLTPYYKQKVSEYFDK